MTSHERPFIAMDKEEAMLFTTASGKPRYPTRAEVKHDEVDLAEAILQGAVHRPTQAFGHYFEGRGASCALGAAYDGMYVLPRDADGVRPVHLERLFDCLEYTLRSCPEGCKKRLALGAMILHLNDDHHWSRESIAQWVAPPPESKAEAKGPATP